MKYIFGLGLPRTGTNSLGSALHLLGINGECKCILNDFHNKREKDDNSKEYKYIIYNDAYQELDVLLSDDKIHNNIYILTVRDNDDWKKSISNFDKDIVNELLEINMDDYIMKIKSIFEEKGCIDNLLIINIFNDDDILLWNNLKNYTGLVVSDDIMEEFPKINLNK